MPALCLILLVMLSSAALPSVSAQYIDGGTTRSCARISAQLTMGNGDFSWNFESEYQRSIQPFITSMSHCPYNAVCAQKLTAVEGQVATYSEDCWELNTMTEYTEVACYKDLCNQNLTFGRFPAFSKSNFRPGSRLRCYNHGQLFNMDNYREIISDTTYLYRYYRKLPYGDWGSGMCGVAIYASRSRSRVNHERVITGDDKQKFAVLRVCPSTGCDRGLVRDVMIRGFNS